jgi:hypothetical protein
MEPEGSLMWSEESAIFLYPEPDESKPLPPIRFFKKTFNRIFPSETKCKCKSPNYVQYVF